MKKSKIVKTKMEIGGRKSNNKTWIWLDLAKSSDIQQDLRQNKPLPLEDNLLTKFYSSHCIEHISNESFKYLLKELYRTCQSGCILRFACPDADILLNAYHNNAIGQLATNQTPEEALCNWFVSYACGQGIHGINSEEVQKNIKTMAKEDFLDWIITHVDERQPYIAHRNWFDFNKLQNFLAEAGFVDIYKSQYKVSLDQEMRGFDLHQEISLFVECKK